MLWAPKQLVEAPGKVLYPHLGPHGDDPALLLGCCAGLGNAAPCNLMEGECDSTCVSWVSVMLLWNNLACNE